MHETVTEFIIYKGTFLLNCCIRKVTCCLSKDFILVHCHSVVFCSWCTNQTHKSLWNRSAYDKHAKGSRLMGKVTNL